VDDNPDILLAAKIVLKKQFQSVQTEANPQKLPKLLAQQNFDVILLDMNFSPGATSGQQGIRWLNTVRDLAPESKVILMTAYAGIELAIKVIKQGATDFVIKPWDNAKLLATVVAAMRHNQSDRELRQLQARQRKMAQLMGGQPDAIIGESVALQQVMKQVSKVAMTDANVLILGENGTGKELVARAIHQQSSRCEQAFVNVDIGAIAQSLFESELFGHKKGAFTDAIEDRAGRFEIASTGSLFLDEIGNLNTQMQAKLLGALQSMTISRVGSDTPIKVDTRMICATNMPLYEMVDDSQFRQDLLYRINTVEIRIPPLRERPSDIPVLAKHFADLYAHKYQKQEVSIDSNALSKLKEYHWPGNVRELQHAIERAIIMAENQSLQAEDFLLKKPLKTSIKPRSLNLEQLEKETIQQAILKHEGNLSQASKELGLARATLYRKMTKHGI
jgi:two-component system, NtrC family, response regulator HydG